MKFRESLLFFICYALTLGRGCRSGDRSSLSSSWPSPRRSDFRRPTTAKIHVLNSGDELVALTTNIRARTGDFVFGRLVVPFNQFGHMGLTVSAFWKNAHASTPLWLYLRKSKIPSTSTYDKTSISFVSRKFSRIRLERADPGSYYIMLEALVDLRNVTIGVSLVPSKLFDATEVEYRPDWETDWISQNEIK